MNEVPSELHAFPFPDGLAAHPAGLHATHALMKTVHDSFEPL
jgi:hypothetical protein